MDYEGVMLPLLNCFEKQTALCAQGANGEGAYELDEINDAKNFLYAFRQKVTFKNAAPFCIAVGNIVRQFEGKQMANGKPTGFFLKLFGRNVLWECRHIELIYLKYLCVKTAQTMGDERNLKEFIQRFVAKTETKLGSEYNELVVHLKKLLEKVKTKKIVLRQYLGMNSPEKQAAENARLQKKNTELEAQVRGLKKTIIQKDKQIINLSGRLDIAESEKNKAIARKKHCTRAIR